MKKKKKIDKIQVSSAIDFKRYSIKYFLLALLYTFVFLLPFFFNPAIRSNDLLGDLLPLVYTKVTLLHNHIFPQWIPYINQGLPMIADPLYSFYNPLVTVPILLFPLDFAIKLIYATSFCSAIFCMYLLLRLFAISKLPSFILGLTYASGGYFVSRITAGHFEKILSYPLLPLFLYCLFRSLEKNTFLRMGSAAFVLTLIYFSGDFYNMLYGCVVLGVIIVYLLFTHVKKILLILLIGIFFLSFSAIKIFPFLQLQKYIYHVVEPFAGSQNPISILYYIFLPVKFPFLLIHTKQFITTDFAWWGKISYIGSFTFLGVLLFFLYFKKIKEKYKYLLCFLLLTFLLLSMPAWRLNPYHILLVDVKILQLFHVPSNIFAFMSIIFLLMAGIATEHFLHIGKEHVKKLVVVLLLINLLMTAIFSQYILHRKQLNPINPNYKTAMLLLKQKDTTHYYIAQFISQSALPQETALENNQQLLEENYGLQLMNSPAMNFTPYDFGVSKAYHDIMPKYLIVDSTVKLPRHIVFSLKKYFLYKDVTVYSVPYATPFIEMSNRDKTSIQLENIGVDTISFQAKSNIKQKLTIFESYYPGWQATVNGKKIALLPSRFLILQAKQGTNRYVLRFSSEFFVIGAMISLLAFATFSIGVWRFLIKKMVSHAM